jgi:hypothetical protein
MRKKPQYHVRAFTLDDGSYQAILELADAKMLSISAAARLLIQDGITANKKRV